MAQRRSPATLEDVARAAGVSISTASRTLNGRPTKVSQSTQARVRAAAETLGYATNLAAQAMASGRSSTIGLLTGQVPDDYQNPVVAGVFRSAASRDRLVATAVFDHAEIERTRAIVRQLRGLRAPTVFLVGTSDPEAPGMPELLGELQLVEEDGGRVVLIGQTHPTFDSVVVDDVRAGADMASALVELGYRRFAVLAGAGSGLLAPRRLEGFATALADLGVELPPDAVIWNDFDHDGGYRGAGELLRRRPGVEAVVCSNDAMAIGASVRFREAGLVVGRDIALAGCDDIPALRDVDPPLTSMHLPWDEAADAAFALAEHERSDGRSVVLAGYPVIRLSTPGLAG
ncbi:MAG: LacI family DNA-binding transcriptional regulator [Salana multivorans]|uniref:LacI family DNA-binding transcriptional regulator n=1 Tax=Salana multivorans TaxID=120377 RepID=UPI001ACED027|nr:LacI family DNA-binding transcriptional regulator [Salana multivorans]MBN8883838.1 LacI family DNA-binding transcriptional regulator [Salana multivorans]